MLFDQITPGALCFGGGGLLLLAETQPEALASHQPHRQFATDRRTQQRCGRCPLALEQGLTGLLPLQFPAGWIVGPALQHRQRRADVATLHCPPRLHRGCVLQGRGQPLQGLESPGPGLFAQQGCGLAGLAGARRGFGQLQQQTFGLGLLLAAATEQGPAEG